MLEASKNRLLEKLFSFYNRNLLKRYFNNFRIEGLDNVVNNNSNLPLIIYCNHSTWWDGLIAFEISRKIESNSYFLMEEKHLKKYPFFRKLGAFSVVRESSREMLKSLAYAAAILSESSSATLWIFPQGEILPNDSRPIVFFNGLSRIIQKVGDCSTASLAMRLEFSGEIKPDIFVRIEKVDDINVDSEFNPKLQTKNFAEKLTANLDQLKIDISTRNLKDYISIF